MSEKYENVDGLDVNATPSRVENVDVLVVGGGNAGMEAAASANEEGGKVILIEKEKTINMMRLALASIGSNSQKRIGLDLDKREIVESEAAFAQHNVDERLLNVWADYSAETVNWLEDHILKPHGAHFRSEPDAMVTSKIYAEGAHPTESDATIDDKSFASYGQWFVQYQEEHGVDLRFETTLVSLIKKDGRVTGALVKDLAKDDYYEIDTKRGVIIATGGYSANTDLLKKWNPLSLKKNVYNDSPRSNGAGITAALNVGAIRDAEPAQIIFDRGLVKPGVKTEDQYYQAPNFDHWLWIGSHPFLKLNLRGERFANESIPYQFMTNAATKEPGYLYAEIWDDDYDKNAKVMHMLGCARYGFPGYMFDGKAIRDNVEENIKDGYIIKADTIEELAEKLHLPVDKVVASVKQNNEDSANRLDSQFDKEAFRITPIEKGPFYGCILGGRCLATFDGLRITPKMEVIDENYDPIPGLYAAGNDAGGFFWGSYNDRTPGMAAGHAHTFGRLAGKYIMGVEPKTSEEENDVDEVPVADVEATSGASH